MVKEYDFTNAKPNPYFKKLRKQISIRIDIDTIGYFKKKAEERITIDKIPKKDHLTSYCKCITLTIYGKCT